MAFKMADGSLFAILLRSPWWYSFLIAAALLALSIAVASGQYIIFGVTAGLPFLVLSAFAGYRQWQRPSSKRIQEVMQLAREMRASALADKIASAYTNEQFNAVAFKGNAADLQLTRGSRTILLSCKRFKAATTGIDPLKELVAAGEKADATGYLFVALGGLSENARSYAKQHSIELIQPDVLATFFDGKAKIT